MADEPPEVNEHIGLGEQVGRVPSAGQQRLSTRRQSASSLDGVLVLARHMRQLILNVGSVAASAPAPRDVSQ